MDDISRGVTDVSVFQLVQRLCEHLAEDARMPRHTKNTFQAPTKVAPWSIKDNTKLTSHLVRVFYDRVLLRRWEWFGVSESSSIRSPASRCMSSSYQLVCEGRHDDSRRLVEAVSWLTETSVFRECEAMLTFLSLLAEVHTDTSKPLVMQPVKESEPFRYEMYLSPFFERSPHDSGLCDVSNDFSDSISLFECTPSTGFDSFLSAYHDLEDSTLYNGLVHCTVENINTPLGLPQLPSSADTITLLPHMKSREPDKETVSVCTTSEALSQELSSWPLGESEPDSVKEWEGWQTRSRQYLCDGPDSLVSSAVELCLSRYCPWVGVAQSDVEGNSSLVSRLIRDLDDLPTEHLNTFQESGSVSRMFGEAVQSLQDYFRAQLHQLAGATSSDLALTLSTHWILPTIKFLTGIWNGVSDLPKSVSLLDALYNQACVTASTPYYLLLLHLLTQALAPYFKFVEQWVFQGWLNMGEEFGLHVNIEALARRDEKYWSDGYTSSVSGCTPGFLTGQAHTILTCGKALNLLRICKPSHPLCTGMFCWPKLRVQLSVDALEQCNLQCQQYGRNVLESEQVRHELFKQEMQSKEKELRAEVLKARQEARAHAEKVRLIEESYKTQEKEKKIALRDALLEQMRTNQALRTEQEAEEHAQDMERLDYHNTKDTLQVQREAALQEKAREDMITHYAELSREAELRRLRAEWRAKRYELSSQRFEFLSSERKQLVAENKVSVSASKPPTPQRPTSNSFLQEAPSDVTVSTYQLDEAPTVNVSRIVDNTDTRDAMPRKTLAESSFQEQQVTIGQTSQKTWVATMADRPVQTVESNVAQDPSHFNEESASQDHFSVVDTNSTQSINSGPLPRPSHPTSVIHPQETTNPAILSRLSQIEVRSPRAHSGLKEQLSVAQELLYPTAQLAPVSEEGVPRLVSSRGQETSSTAQDLMYGSGHDTETSAITTRGREPSTITTRGCEPSSTAEGIIYDSSAITTRGCEPSSTAEGIIYDSSAITTRGCEPSSTAEGIIYDSSAITSRGCELSSTAEGIIYDSSAITSRGREPSSTAEGIIYSSDWADVATTSGPLIQETGHPLLVSTRGQAPQSTAQIKMYPLRYTEHSKEEVIKREENKQELELPAIEYGPSFKYKDDFSFNGNPSPQDMLSAVLGPGAKEDGNIDTQFLSVYPLSALIEQSLALPILTQWTLVNEALLRYFLSECRIRHHFHVIKWFLLLEDGEFGHALSTRLCEELTHGRSWRVLVSPSFLNPLLSAALEVSVHSHCPEAKRISFALKYRPTSINPHAIDAMEFLQLKYEVDWPCNIVITRASIEKYNKILQLLLQMKRASWALKNTFHQLQVCGQLSLSQTRQLQVYRHEYQHFINVMHGYIANQVFQITWREFENDLEKEVHSFEELIKAHHSFINKAIFRCLLSKKAAPVMKLIQSIFSSILKFSSYMRKEGGSIERSYAAMADTHTKFREVSSLLIKVVDKLVQRGYQPHLEDFLLRLDFNRFYKQS